MAEKVKLSTSQVANDLKNGMTRDEIKEKYSLDSNSMKKLFNTPSLKGRRTQKAPLFELTDDIPQEEVREVPKRAAATKPAATTETATAAPKKKASTAKITSSAPTVTAAKTEEEVVLEEETEVVSDVVASPIKEVDMPDDNIETKEPTEVDTKKGLW